MKFPLPVLKEKIVFATGTSTVAAGSTVYIYSNDQGGEGSGQSNASETIIIVNYLVARSGFLKNLVACSRTAPGVGQTFTYTVRINGVATSITCQIAGATAVTASDLVNTAKVTVGDRVTVELVTSAGAGVIQHHIAILLETLSTWGHYEHQNFSSGTSTVAVNTTTYLAPIFRSTFGGFISVEVYRSIVVRKGTLKNLIVLAGAAPGAGETFVYTVRVNGVNTAMTVTLSGAAQLTGTDVVNVVQIDAGDRITLKCVTSAAAAVTTHAASFDFEEGDYRAG